jgi:hypothetical protein
MANESQNESKIGEFFVQIRDNISEQQWFQELKGKWEELDPQSRTNLKLGGMGAGILLLGYLLLNLTWSVHAIKKDYTDKQELLTLIENATDQMRKVQELHPNLAPNPGDEKDDWNAYLQQTAGGNGIDKAVLTISPPKTVGPTPAPGTQGTLESEIDVAMKHVSIKQVIRFAFALENGSKPIKLRNLTIDTGSDPTGYMDATLTVSAFTLASNK